MACHRASAHTGSSLVEAVIAAGLLATVLGGVLPLLSVVALVLQAMRDDLMAAHLARQRLAQLQALTHVRAPSGLVSDDLSRLDGAEPFALGGTGLTPTGLVPLEATTAAWVDWLDEQGAWVASGTEPPGEARFRRRWGILPGAADGCVMLWADVAPLGVRALPTRSVQAGALRCPWGAGEP